MTANLISEIYPTPFPESEEEYDLCVCHYSAGLIVRKDSIVLGPVIPQAPMPYVCHPLANDARKRSIVLFNETEQNCNTCKYLQRVPFDRRSFSVSGLMPGICLHSNPEPLYPVDGNKIMFAPDDCMLQECYSSR